MSKVLKLFNALSHSFASKIHSVPTELHNTIVDFSLGDRRIMPRIPKDTVHTIAEQAIKGDLVSMGTLSMFYSVGLGVPQNKNMCMAWAAMSIMEAPHVSAEKVFKRTRSDVSEIPGNFAYPDFLRTELQRFVPQYSKGKLENINGHYRISAQVKGIPLNLAYRFHGQDCYLYSASLSDGTILLLDDIHRLRIPKIIGAHSTNLTTIPDYKDRVSHIAGKTPRLLIVSGVLAVPNSLKAIVKQYHGECKTVGDLFRKLMVDNATRFRFESSEELQIKEKELEALRAKRKRVITGDYKSDLESEWSRLKSRSKRNAEYVTQANSLKLEYKMCKEGTLDAALLKEIKATKRVLEALREADAVESANHKYKYIENILKFVPDDVFYCSNKGATPLALRTDFKTHLQSCGFQCDGLSDTSMFVTPKDGINLPTLVKKLSNPEYTIKSIILRSVNKADKVKPFKIHL